MELISDKLTPMSASEVLAALKSALGDLLGDEPSRSALAVFCAQSALECARWRSMHCYNFGNIRPPAGWPGKYCQFRCNEQVKPGVWRWFNPPDPGSNFVAFESAEEGARFYVEKLRKRWPEAFQAALAGLPDQFVHALKARNYFTADETPYRNEVISLTKEFIALLDRQEPPALPPEHEPDWDAIRQIVWLGEFHPEESAAQNLNELSAEDSGQ